MGFGGLSIGHLLVVLVIVLLVFGTKRLKTIGSDLGNAVKGFRNAMASVEKDDEEAEAKQIEQEPAKRVAGAEPAAAKPVESGEDRPKGRPGV